MGITEGPYTGKPNPHAWMSPANAVIYVENIRKALVKMDPANEATYNANAAAYSAKIKALDEPVREKLAAIPRGAALAGQQRGCVFLSLRELRTEASSTSGRSMPTPRARRSRCGR